MCGFFFQYNKKNSDFIDSDIILKLISHRGPDDKGVYKTREILAVHTLLKIQDVTNKSRQPFSIRYKKKKFNIVYNGEIYNKAEVKKKISNIIEYKFKTDGDTELFLLSFILWGEDFIKKIEGMYAYVIWEDNTNEIYFGRDQFMQKPLYYFDSKKYLILSSEIKPILQSLKFHNEKIFFNKDTIKDYLLTNNFSNNQRTFFKPIKQLVGGNIGSMIGKRTKIRNVLKLKKPHKKFKKFNQTSEFESFSENIVNQHLVGKVKIGIALSSGADSRYLLYLINKNKKLSKNLTAFTFAFENFENEIKSAKIICKKLKIKHSIIYLKKKELLNDFKKLIRFNEFPIGGLPQIAMFKLCKKAREKGIKVLIGGYGADEHFGSYKTFLLKNVKDNQLIDGRVFDNKNFLKDTNQNKTHQNKIIKQNFYEKKISYFLNLKIPRTSLMCDRFSMSNSVEFRNPFLDRRIYNFVNQSKYEYMKTENKYPIINILKSKGLFNNSYKKNYIQSPQNEYMKSKKIIKILKDIIYDTEFVEVINFFKMQKITEELKNNQILAWQIMNIYYFFHVFKEFVFTNDLKKGKKIFNILKK